MIYNKNIDNYYKSPTVQKTINTLYFQGFLVDVDKYDRLKVKFLDDYGLDSNKLSFTKSYLLNKCKQVEGNNPLTENDTCFYIKTKGNNVGYINNKPHPIIDLKQHQVQLQIEIKSYNFKKKDTRHQGWYINLKKIELLEF
jgi:hypothetical protein